MSFFVKLFFSSTAFTDIGTADNENLNISRPFIYKKLFLSLCFFIPLLNALKKNTGGNDKNYRDNVPDTDGLPLTEGFP